MAKLELKGELMDVLSPVTVGDKGTVKQSIILLVPGYHDGFEKKGKDEYWMIDIMGQDNITKFALSGADKGKRCKVSIFVNSMLVIKNNPADPTAASTPMYIVNNNLQSILFADVKQQTH